LRSFDDQRIWHDVEGRLQRMSIDDITKRAVMHLHVETFSPGGVAGYGRTEGVALCESVVLVVFWWTSQMMRRRWSGVEAWSWSRNMDSCLGSGR
jgi:hypothetical protein